jgi:hypothetical protein
VVNDGNLMLTNCTIEDNSANSEGGGGGMFNYGTATVTNCAIEDNSAGQGGGIYNGGNVTVIGSTIAGNSAPAGGGILNISGSMLTITDSTIAGNTSFEGLGGGIYNDAGTTSITTSNITQNSAANGGGGIFNNDGSLTIAGTTLADNSGHDGGGILNDTEGTVTVTNATISDNSATNTGGGISNLVGTLIVTNTSIAGNSAPYGGGIFNYVSSTLTAVNCTIAYNVATSGSGSGAGLDVGDGTATLENTIVALNTDGAGGGAPADDIALHWLLDSVTGTISSASAYNLFGTGGAGGLINGINGNQDGVADPGLGALADNGGPTQTIALLPGSPALGAGSNALAVDAQGSPLTTDQRGPGFARIMNGTVDIGAFEVQATALTPPTSHVVNSLGTSQTSDTFTVPISFSDPAGPGSAPASGVSSLELWVSVNNGAFSLYQTMNLAPTSAGTDTFTFTGQDRNIYAFHSIAIDAAGNTENKNSNTIEASTSIPDLNPPVTHVLASSPSFSWGVFPSSEFSSLIPSSYSNGVFTLNWAGADPDQNSGVPAGSISLVNIYVEIDDSTPKLIGQLNGGAPNGNGVYSGSLSYNALADGQSHNYSFFIVGVDDQQKEQCDAQAGLATPDVTFSNITYSAPLAVENLVVEQGIAERSFIQYLAVDFNQSVSTSSALQDLASGLAGTTPSTYVQLLWYGKNVTSGALPMGIINLFNNGTTATVSLTGNDLSINFGASAITSLLTELGVPGTGKPTTSFGDGWYALGIDTTGGNGQPSRLRRVPGTSVRGWDGSRQ